MISNIVTAVLVSVVSVLITSLVAFLLIKRNKSIGRRQSTQQDNKDCTAAALYDIPNIKDHADTCGPRWISNSINISQRSEESAEASIYDLPNIDDDEMMKSNAAYGALHRQR